MSEALKQSACGATVASWSSRISFTVWTIFAIAAVMIEAGLHLTEAEFDLGSVGGFARPIVFGVFNDLTDVRTNGFMLFFVLVGIALPWMLFAVRLLEQARFPGISTLPDFPEFKGGGQPPATKS